MEDGSLLRLGSGPASSHHHHAHAGTLKGESLGWAGSDKFSKDSLLVLMSLPERRYQTRPTSALYFKSLWVIFLVISRIRDQLHTIPNTVVLSEMFNQFKCIHILGFFECFCLLFQWQFPHEISGKWDQCSIWPLTLAGPLFQFPSFSSIMRTDQTVF